LRKSSDSLFPGKERGNAAILRISGRVKGGEYGWYLFGRGWVRGGV